MSRDRHAGWVGREPCAARRLGEESGSIPDRGLVWTSRSATQEVRSEGVLPTSWSCPGRITVKLEKERATFPASGILADYQAANRHLSQDEERAMRGDYAPGAPGRSTGSAVMSPSEKLVCEWEARHDVAARGRQVDPAAALHRYLPHARVEEGLHHQDHPAHRVELLPMRCARHTDEFAAQHPLAASWLRWGEDLR
jgi:hypothetical protein